MIVYMNYNDTGIGVLAAVVKKYLLGYSGVQSNEM
jgi:hypothetical protein